MRIRHARLFMVVMFIVLLGVLQACSFTSLLGKKKKETLTNIAPTAIAIVTVEPTVVFTPSPVPVATRPISTKTPLVPQMSEGDDDALDFYTCGTKEPVLKQYAQRVNPKVYLDVRHVKVEVMPLENSPVTVNGKMCAYRIIATYDHPIQPGFSLQGVVAFVAGGVEADYFFALHDRKVQWAPTVRNLDTGAAVVPVNLAGFSAKSQNGNLVLTIPCYGVPVSGGKSTFKMTTFTTKPSGKRQYCDYVEFPPTLPPATVVWKEGDPITITDDRHDVIDMTHHVDGIDDAQTDITMLTVRFQPPLASVEAKVATFPPIHPDIEKWSSAFRINLLIVGGAPLLCSPMQKDSDLPACEFDNLYHLASSGCIVVNGDYYLTYSLQGVQHKDHLARTVLCYDQP